ncbi:MAG TPA: hypothetical protein VND19_04745 [Acetobacteraceae bacterium]|nr:hypothetical protein [Acetobacteraceae bacterium]
MLTIRQSQLAALEQVALNKAELVLLTHLREAFQREHALLGDARMMHVVRLAIQRAEAHGHTGMREIFLYATLMLGAFFDEDPQLGWLAPLMRDVTHLSPPERLDAAHEAVMRYLDEIAGEENEHLIRALLRMRDVDLAAAGDLAADESGSGIADLLTGLFPQKACRHGDAAMRLAAGRGAALARQHGMRTGPGIVLLSALVFTLGWRFHEDPQFPWAQAALGPRDGHDAGPLVPITSVALGGTGSRLVLFPPEPDGGYGAFRQLPTPQPGELLDARIVH